MADAETFQPSGRTVRCASCGHAWHQSPPADLPLKALPNYSGIAPHEASGGLEKQGRALAGQVLGWMVLIGFTAAIAAAGYVFRVEVVQLWPQTASLYAAIGKPVNPRGLAFRSIVYEEEDSDGVRALIVMGEIVNTSETPQIVPDLQFTLHDRRQREIFDWKSEPPVALLDPGQVSPFVTRMTSPPLHAQELTVRFATSGSSNGAN